MGMPIIEVPIKYYPRTYEEGKKLKAKDAVKGMFMLLRTKLTDS